ncbi:lamin tail domain-containing protein [Candidatus Woesearchaeota archaeon]|nr:lamin tail domain-containing protein [Candidatus Woesearchaeota archaeon]
MRNRIALAMCILNMLLMPGICLAADHIVISEVLYDPVGTETGGEAAELYNPTAGPIDISGYTIKTESSPADATIPAGTVLQAHTFYLIADTGWSTLKDNASWPQADHEEAITMSNTDAGVALVHPNGTTIDAVGWGDPAGIGTGLYEGTPKTVVASGNSIRRTDLTIDTDDNSADFTASAPEPQNSSMTAGGEEGNGQSIMITVDVENNPPSVDTVAVLGDEDISTAGVQVSPVPESTKEVEVSADITDTDSTTSIMSVFATVSGPAGQKNLTMEKTSDLNSTTARYGTTILMEFHESAGMYNVTITAEDPATSGTLSTEFEYLSMTAISVDSASLHFTGAKPGGTTDISGDFALSTADAPTVRNIGNTRIDIGVYGTNLVDGTKSIAAENIKYSLDNDFESDLAGTLTTGLQIMSLGMDNGADSVASLGFRLYVPPATQNGNYTSTITIVAVSS